MSITLELNASNVLGFCGGAMMVFQAIPNLVNSLKDHIEFNVPDEQMSLGVMVTNLIGGL
jgi:hypothetical protein